MNWRNGFFRLWAAISLIWVIATFSSHQTDLFGKAQKKNVILTVELAGGTIIEVGGNDSIEVLRQKIIDEVKKDAEIAEKGNRFYNADELKSNASKNADKILERLRYETDQRNERDEQKFSNAIKTIFIPPSILLILGLLIGWVVGGFKTQ